MSSQETHIDEKKKLLYTYWHELPYLKFIDSTVYFQVWESEIKSFINKYIRDGIEDDFGKEHNLLRRHAFTAKELHKSAACGSKKCNYHRDNF